MKREASEFLPKPQPSCRREAPRRPPAGCVSGLLALPVPPLSPCKVGVAVRL